MARIITLFLPVLMTTVVLSPEAKAQQLTPTEAARAAAAGPEFCPRGPCPGFADIKGLERSVSPKVPKLAGQPKTGPFPPQPYQSSRAELQTPAQPQPQMPAQPGDYSPALEARSHRIFGWGNVTNEPARQRWMADQEQRAVENEINRSKALVYPVSGR